MSLEKASSTNMDFKCIEIALLEAIQERVGFIVILLNK